MGNVFSRLAGLFERVRHGEKQRNRTMEDIEEELKRERMKREKAEEERKRAEKEKETETAARRRAEQNAARAEETKKAEAAARRMAEENAARAEEAENNAKEKWRKGIQPVVWPTEEQYYNTLEARQYKEGYFHFAVAGTAGCGKSSLINAFRGVINGSKKKAAAATGVTETTLEIGRYPDPRQDYPFVWYDIPGAGTLEIPRWEYFNQQGLFIFDCIIVLWDKRFIDTDLAILENCTWFNIPCFIVRSNSDTHIRSLVDEMKEQIEEDIESEDERERLLESVESEALAKYCEDSRKSVKTNLQRADLPLQKVYLVNKSTLRKVVRGEKPRKGDLAIDEVDLIHDILLTADLRRCIPRKNIFKSGANFLIDGVHALSNVVSMVTRKQEPDQSEDDSSAYVDILDYDPSAGAVGNTKLLEYDSSASACAGGTNLPGYY